MRFGGRKWRPSSAARALPGFRCNFLARGAKNYPGETWLAEISGRRDGSRTLRSLSLTVEVVDEEDTVRRHRWPARARRGRVPRDRAARDASVGRHAAGR